MNHKPVHAAGMHIGDDVVLAKVQAHRANVARYARLLATEPTQTEREFIHRRLREERLALEALAQGDTARPVSAAPAAKGTHRHARGDARVPASWPGRLFSIGLTRVNAGRCPSGAG